MRKLRGVVLSAPVSGLALMVFAPILVTAGLYGHCFYVAECFAYDLEITYLTADGEGEKKLEEICEHEIVRGNVLIECRVDVSDEPKARFEWRYIVEQELVIFARPVGLSFFPRSTARNRPLDDKEEIRLDFPVPD